MDETEKWSLRFLRLAYDWSRYSKDPSTKTGSVIARPDRTVASIGFNGFPRRVQDTPERLHDREQKYRRIVHCEINAMLTAREPLHGYTLYNWPGRSCSRCAGPVIQSGITTIVSPSYTEDMESRWGADAAIADEMLAEAGVQNVILPRDWIWASWEAGLHLP
jgi:dCMP deaminase